MSSTEQKSFNNVDLEKGQGELSTKVGITVIANESESSLDSSSSLNAGQSSSSSISGSEVVKVEVLKNEDEPIEIPQKRGNKVTRYLRHNFFSTYRKSFAVIFIVNMAVFIGLVISARGAPPSTHVGAAASVNLMVAILFRQENFVNLCYEICTAAPLSWPLSIRKRLAKVFHYGGCHSGCGVAAVVWYMLYTILVTKEYVNEPEGDVLANMITSWVLVTMFFIILGGAYPSFRIKHHDTFEAFHRFAGWTALITFWIHNVFSAAVIARQTNSTTGMVILKSVNFWTILVSTSCTLLSWSRLRLHTVYPEKLSEHATRLHFKYRTMQPFYGVKLSDKPLTEWHAFATIPDTDPETGKINGFSVVVSNAGDWTKRQIQNTSPKLWIRGYPLHGLLYTSRLFRRIVVVATGSGIGPCLSLLFADITPRRVLWSTPHPETTYNTGVVDAVKKADPKAIIWNTRTQGRPDMVRLTYELVKESDAEAVFIISNPKVTRKVVYGMQTRGIAAYGAIFDS